VARPGDGVSLKLWLEMLGWQMTSKRVGKALIGVATHTDGDGRELHVVGRGNDEGELTLQLFEAAMNAGAIAHRPVDQQLVAA